MSQNSGQWLEEVVAEGEGDRGVGVVAMAVAEGLSGEQDTLRWKTP